MQTATSFKARMIMLLNEVNARHIQLPVVLMLDNHGSRYTEEMLSWFDDHKEEIRPWTEKANTSSWAQALDQLNHKFHLEMHKAKKRYKREHQHPDQHESQVTITYASIINIFKSMWFHWSSHEDRKTSFAKVGILQNRIAPWCIERSGFNDSADSNPLELLFPPNVKSLASVESTVHIPDAHDFVADELSIEQLQQENNNLRNVVELYKEMLVSWESATVHSPLASGILQPPAAPSANHNRRRRNVLSDYHGK